MKAGQDFVEWYEAPPPTQQAAKRGKPQGQATMATEPKKQFMENGADVFEKGVKSKTGHDSTSEKMGPLERKIGQLTM